MNTNKLYRTIVFFFITACILLLVITFVYDLNNYTDFYLSGISEYKPLFMLDYKKMEIIQDILLYCFFTVNAFYNIINWVGGK